MASPTTLKRGRYVHFARDKTKDTWIYQNLINQAVLEAKGNDNTIIYNFLNDPNRAAAGEYEEAVRDLLIQHRFLLPSNINELQILEKRYLYNKTTPILQHIAIVTTLQCNLRCRYCYQDHVDDFLSDDDEEAIINLLATSLRDNMSHKKLRNFRLTWWGGEPLLGIDRINRMSKRIMPLFEAAGVPYGCYTSSNGVLLTQDTCEKLRDVGLRRIQITIDGPARFHNEQRPNVGGKGSYTAIVRGLHNISSTLSHLGRFVTLRINVTKEMAASLGEWDSFFNDIRPSRDHLALSIQPAAPNDFFAPDRAIDNGNFVETLIPLEEMARQHGFELVGRVRAPIPGDLFCGAIPDLNWTVLPGRRLTKCTDKFHDTASDCGRLERDGSITLFEKAQEWLGYSPFSNPQCRECEVLPICMGGCRIIPFASTKGDRCFRKTTLEKSILSNPSRGE